MQTTDEIHEKSAQSVAGLRLAPIPVAYIAGWAHCGSTLTSFLLNTHPQIFSLGEMGPYEIYEREGYPCSCGASLSQCPFFSQVAQRMEAMGVPFDLTRWKLRWRISPNPHIERLARGPLGNRQLEEIRYSLLETVPAYKRLMRDYARRNEAFVRAALEVSGKQVFLDATKDPERIRDLRRVPGFRLNVLHLVRDPRGHCNSIRKKKAIPLHVIAQRWVTTNKRVEWQLNLLPNGSWIRRRYECLCANPSSEFSTVAQFFGADAFAFPANFRSAPHHIVGNRMRESSDAHIRTDEQWKTELSTSDQRLIARITGNLAREYGYEI